MEDRRSRRKSARRRLKAERHSFLIISLYRFEGSPEAGGLAQQGERVLCKHEVIGSSPIFSTKWGKGKERQTARKV